MPVAMNLNELAKSRGLHSFDCAVPQPWADHVRELTGIYPPGFVVWSYDESHIFGAPEPVCNLGALALLLYESSGGRS